MIIKGLGWVPKALTNFPFNCWCAKNNFFYNDFPLFSLRNRTALKSWKRCGMLFWVLVIKTTTESCPVASWHCCYQIWMNSLQGEIRNQNFNWFLVYGKTIALRQKEIGIFGKNIIMTWRMLARIFFVWLSTIGSLAWIKIWVNLLVNNCVLMYDCLNYKSVNYDRPGECSPEKDCL